MPGPSRCLEGVRSPSAGGPGGPSGAGNGRLKRVVADLIWRQKTTGDVALWVQDGFQTLEARVFSTMSLDATLATLSE